MNPPLTESEVLSLLQAQHDLGLPGDQELSALTIRRLTHHPIESVYQVLFALEDQERISSRWAKSTSPNHKLYRIGGQKP